MMSKSNPLPAASKQFRLKLAERVLWTAAQAGLGVLTVEVLDVPVAWAPIVATALAALKGYVARRVGNPQEPATLPWGV
jgi:hypothetical protein